MFKDIKTERFPQCIYKYRALNDAFYKILLNHSLWFSNPENFNDPYDCRVLVDHNYSEDEIRDLYKSKGGIPEDAETAIKNPKLFEKIVNDEISKAISKSGICCFAKKETVFLCGHIILTATKEYA